MGMFKDIKKLSDQGKDIQKQQGKRTGMIGMMRDMPDTINQATAAVDDAMALQAEMQRQQMLLSTGTPGRATIKGLTDTGALVNFNPQVILDLEIAVDGKDPYDTQLSTSIPQVFLARVQPGSSIGVRTDPADPASIAIDWAQP
jgi:hypothetical protein